MVVLEKGEVNVVDLIARSGSMNDPNAKIELLWTAIKRQDAELKQIRADFRKGLGDLLTIFEIIVPTTCEVYEIQAIANSTLKAKTP